MQNSFENEIPITPIRVILEENLLSQNELAKKCGVSGQSVSNWLNDVRNPSVPAKKKLMAIVRGSEHRSKKDDELLLSVISKQDRAMEQFGEMVEGMTDEQRSKLTKMVEKMGG